LDLGICDCVIRHSNGLTNVPTILPITIEYAVETGLIPNWLAVCSTIVAEANMGTYIKYAFFWIWGFAIVLLGIAVLIGTVTI
jgi:CitMHS family citrate-Mg2+:H+ or citrate-Ca2+:H+ symporter